MNTDYEKHSLPLNETVAVEEKVEEDSPAIAGLCPSCLNTGFVHSIRNGVLGIVAIEVGSDTTGSIKRSLMVCECKVDTKGI